jgi:hypothetical protein
MNGKNNVCFSHKSDEYGTPLWLFELLNEEFNFDFDAAANLDNTKCEQFSNDSLEMDWSQKKIYFLILHIVKYQYL